MADDEVARLYRMYGAVIYARCRGLLGDDAEAEDATQETFVRVYKHLSRVPEGREALFWIHRVATNHCLSELKRRWRRRALPAQLAEPGPAGSPAIEQRFTDRDLARAVIARTQA